MPGKPTTVLFSVQDLLMKLCLQCCLPIKRKGLQLLINNHLKARYALWRS